MDKPYIVSCDIYLLTKEWAKRESFVVPEIEFFGQLRREFSAFMRRIFPGFELVSEEELSCGLSELVVQSNLPVVSLDDVYIKSELCLEITRLVDITGKDKGLGSRAGSPSLLHQLRELVRKLAASDVSEIALVDDVIFTGALMERMVNLLSRIGIRVPIICAGIGIAEGIQRIDHTKREVHCVRTYEEVIDEICERDFYPGVPMSGRLLAGDDNVGVPYLLPFGNPGSWASIPSEWQAGFSRFCLYQTISLFEEVEYYSHRVVKCADLGRKVIGLPYGQNRYIDVLYELVKGGD